MDLYRYFHPHHNPRLRYTSVRMLELCELQQAAEELRKAVNRAAIRSKETAGSVSSRQLTPIIQALELVVESLAELVQSHPGDDKDTLLQMAQERANAPGWETWTKLLTDRLELLQSAISVESK